MKEKGDQALKAAKEDIQKKNAKELNKKKKLKDQAEFRMKNQKEIEEKLAQVIPKINEVNEMCLQLGRLDYLYSPTIVTEIEGNQMKSKVCIKIYPDHSQSFFNQVDTSEFMEKYYLIQERFQNYQYDVEHNELGKVEDTAEDDTVTFGIAIRNDWILIGQAHVYTDSIANLLETQNDHTPLIDSKGNLNGKFCVIGRCVEVLDNTEVHGERAGTEPRDVRRHRPAGVEDAAGDFENPLRARTAGQMHCRAAVQVLVCAHSRYKWIDDKAEEFQTEVNTSKTINPDFNYERTHDLYVSSHVLGNIWENALVIGVYGKMSQDNLNQLMKGALKDKFKGVANGSSNGKNDTRNTKGDQFQSNNGVEIKINSSLEGLPPKAREAIAMQALV
eukprot:TRINITY_DN6807_c0_g1_i4.p1 TRINITY_DN6807_c0_g1~~TRINITY_DN6807_c0_g1_i4.p1  ORF type:complete len:388 (+),score=71.63 TRINITY_DN6807_c0_g1_i4:115-1278(+)